MRAGGGCQGAVYGGNPRWAGSNGRPPLYHRFMLAPLLALAIAASDAEVPPAPVLEPRLASLQGGETLGVGGSIAAFSAGYSTLSAAYAQGLSSSADYGLQLEFDWLTTELFAGGLYRQLTWRLGDTFISWRARAGLYASLGSTYAVDANDAAVGVQIAPGIAVSRRFSSVTASLAGDVPVDITFPRGGGFAIGVRGMAALETPIANDLLLGVRAGGGVLFSTAAAPFTNDSPRGFLDFSLLLTYRLL